MKLGLYSRRGVREYWLIDGSARSVEVYRRQRSDLQLVGILRSGDTLGTGLLPGFSYLIDGLFAGIPEGTRKED